MKINAYGLMEILKRNDFSFWGICGLIFLIGIVNLYSATHASSQLALAEIYQQQLLWFFLALLLGLGISLIHPKTFFFGGS